MCWRGGSARDVVTRPGSTSSCVKPWMESGGGRRRRKIIEGHAAAIGADTTGFLRVIVLARVLRNGLAKQFEFRLQAFASALTIGLQILEKIQVGTEHSSTQILNF